MKSEVYNIDCMEYMKTLPDKYFGLTIADPPYGVSYARGKNGWGVCDNRPNLEDVKWDKEIPQKEFFDELLRVSDKVIIWGGNYFTHLLPVSKCWLVWDKCNGTTNKSVFADAELAWTNMTKVVKMFHLRQMGFISDTKDGKRIHPTQKPVDLLRYLILTYSNEGDTILDATIGSGTTAVAALQLGRKYIGFEISQEYVDIANRRIAAETSQLSLF